MPLLLKIYLLCVAGSCFYIFLTTVIIKIQFRNKYEEMDRSNDPLLMAWRTYDDAPLLFKMLVLFVPVLNLFFCILLLLLLYVEANTAWFYFGEAVYGRFTKTTKEGEFWFKIKYFIIATFFRSWKDCFLDRYLKDQYKQLDIVIKKVIENEKSKCKPECDPDLHTGTGDQKTPAERQEN